MTFSAALTQLAQLAVSGVTHNYGIDSVPDQPQRAQLPALLVLPLMPEMQENRMFRDAGKGFETVAFSSGLKSVTYVVTHLLLIGPVGQSKGLRAHVPLLVSIIDAYFTALGANPLLGATLLQPARVRVEPGVYTLNGQEYYGCAFRHTWLIQA
jgi:hypothetical protein